MAKAKAPTCPDEATIFDKKLAGFTTTLPDSITVGWDTCGRCEQYFTQCRCDGGCRLPRHVISMRADAIRRGAETASETAADMIDTDGESDEPDDDHQAAESKPEATTDEADSDDPVEYGCPECEAAIEYLQDECDQCGCGIDWGDEED